MVEGLLCTVTFLGVTAMAALCAHRLRLDSGAAPLLVLCATVCWYTLAGCLDLLVPAGVLWCAAALAALVLLVVWRRRIDWRALFGPGFVLFAAAGLAVIWLFAVRQPIFMDWDEFSFWGMAAKVVKCTGRLYTFVPGSMIGVTYVPGLVLLDYAFEFLGAAFVPWKVFAAYDILLFAVFAAGVSFCRRRDWKLAVPLFALLALLPYVFTVFYRDIYVRPVYMTAYADVPMALLFAAAPAVYFAAEKKTPAVLLTAALAVTAASLSKDIGFALCLIAAALVCFDLLFVWRGEVRFARLGGVWARLCWCALLFALPVAAFFGWARHLGRALAVSRFDLGGSGQMGMVQMVTTGIAELLGFSRSAKFAQVAADMLDAFFANRLTMLGSGFAAVLVLLCLLALAWLCGGAGQRRTVAWFALLSSLGFAAFYVFNIFTYVYIFKEAEASALSNYNRYIFPYYLGWAAMVLVLLGASLGARQGCRAGKKSVLLQGALFAAPLVLLGLLLRASRVGGKGLWLQLGAAAAVIAALLLAALLPPGRRPALAPLALVCLAALGIRQTCALVPTQLSVVDYPESYFAGRRQSIAEADAIRARLGEGERVLYVCTGDDGGSWFRRYYDLYPDVILDYSLGGTGFDESSRLNSVSIPRFFTAAQAARFTADGVTMTPQTLCAYLEASGCTAIWLEQVDDSFRALYGSLFDDGLSGQNDLYRITGTGDAMHFVPIAGEVSAQ